MFQETGSFYYCTGGDVTNSIQRCHETAADVSSTVTSPQPNDNHTAAWKQAHDEFFWNKFMLQDLILSGVLNDAIRGTEKYY